MTDERLADLFARGTAPERDAAFVRSVEAEIGRTRLRSRLPAHAMRVLLFLTLASTLFMTVRALEPALGQIAETSPQFMGVPLPLILAVIATGFAVRVLPFIGMRLG